MYRIRDWDEHFERDRTRQWKSLQWVPIPNKQGTGYRKIMREKDGLEIFACWIAMIEIASKCETRGDLSKYSIDDLSLLTLIDVEKLKRAICYLSEVLDWIEVIRNLDTDVKIIDQHGKLTCDSSSILFNSILSNSIQEDKSVREGESHFDKFWKSYPKKVGKGAAKKAWGKIKRPAETLEKITNALSWQKKSEQWARDNGQYIPHPTTYINQCRWDDEPQLEGVDDGARKLFDKYANVGQ